MSKNICSVCNVEVEDEYFDKEQTKCILHCDKTKYHKEENGKQKCQENVLNLFEKAFENHSENYSNKISLKDVHFPANSLLKLMYKLNKTDISIIRCKFYGDEELILNKKDIESIYFYKNTTKYNFKFSEMQTKNLVIQACDFARLEISGSKINRFTISNYFLEIEKEKQINIEEIFINRTEIDNCNIAKIELNNFYIKKSRISKMFFSELIGDNLILRENVFLDRLFFSNTKLQNCIDLETTSIPQNTIFFGLKFINLENRETARIIKDSFEKQNNIIEANKFYALEMEKREKELDFKKDFFEWLVFKIHRLSSNHSQDWLLALFWILSFTFTFLTMDFVNTHYLTHTVDYILIDMIIFLGFVYGNYLIIEYEKINKFLYIGIYYIFYGFFSQDWLLKCFSNKLNPFSIMTGNEELTFSGLIYKIIIAYLIYQLIISIRQNTRRK